MSALLGSILPYLLMAGAALVAFLGYGVKQRAAGRKEQAAKQQDAELAARHTADQVDSDIGIMTPDQRRAELKKWSNHR